MLSKLSMLTINEMYVQGLFIKVKDPSDRDTVQEIMDDLEAATG